MLQKIKELELLIGNTPVKKLKHSGIDLFAKLEYSNFSGSIKDRAALFIIHQAVLNEEVNENTTIIESSSGNFAIALASICCELGLKFIAVIDPNINTMNRQLLEMLTPHVIMVQNTDVTGGYLLTRIEKVKELCAETENSYWPNQYDNKNNPIAYEYGLAQEIHQSFEKLDYIFVAVSSTGTLMGLAKELKRKNEYIKVIAVDIEGSVIFNQAPKKRYISGIGASKVPTHLDPVYIDDVIIVSHEQIVQGCRDLLKKQLVFAGASSGAVYFAACKYAEMHHLQGKTGLIICPDRGYTYLDSIYCNEWSSRFKTVPEKLIH